jgi:hypothetical protein
MRLICRYNLVNSFVFSNDGAAELPSKTSVSLPVMIGSSNASLGIVTSPPVPQAALRVMFSSIVRYDASFFFALNTLHCTVPIGMA